MAAEAKLPTGNLQLTRRVSLLLRRDYFYTEPARPTGDNPLFLNVSGYLAISLVLLVLLDSYFSWLGLSMPGAAALTSASIGLFFLCFPIHLVLWAVSKLWRIAMGHAVVLE